MDVKITVKAEKIPNPQKSVEELSQEIIDAMEEIIESQLTPPCCPKCGRKRFIQYIGGRLGSRGETWYHCTLCDVYVKKNNVDWRSEYDKIKAGGTVTGKRNV